MRSANSRLRQAAVAGLIATVSELPKLEDVRLIQHLTTESAADIYQAVQEPLGREVLVKLLRPNVLPTSPFAVALEREARLLSEISHPYIQRLFDFRRDATRMWLVLEQARGPSLEQILKAHGHLSATAALSVATMLCKALAHCHGLGILHRELRPSHICVTPDGHAVITNFSGAAKERLPTAPELLNSALQPSLLPYMSPEQILGESPDGRTDIYSLGCILYEMLTGAPPFVASDERGIVQKIRHATATAPSRQVPALPNAVDRIVLRCLEKLPNDRYGSTQELLDALQRALRHFTTEGPEQALALELRRVGVFTASLKNAAARIAATEDPAPSLSMRRSVLILGGCFALALVGGFLAQSGVSRGEFPGRAASQRQADNNRVGFLRVVADPWANVSVDGQFLDVTPIARAIPLQQGAHYLQFQHPDAPLERRVVNIAAGETVLLDVKMKTLGTKDSDAGLPLAAAPPSSESP